MGKIGSAEGFGDRNIDRRIRAAEEGFYGLKRLWGRKKGKFRIKRMMLKGVVMNAFMSGLACEAVTRTQMRKMEVKAMGLMRR